MPDDTPYLENETVVDVFELRDYLARVMKHAGLGSEMRIDSGRKLAEHLIREGLIDITAAEVAMADEKRKIREHEEAMDR